MQVGVRAEVGRREGKGQHLPFVVRDASAFGRRLAAQRAKGGTYPLSCALREQERTRDAWGRLLWGRVMDRLRKETLVLGILLEFPNTYLGLQWEFFCYGFGTVSAKDHVLIGFLK